MCRCSSCVGRKSSWAEILPGRVATWVTHDCRHESRERDRAGQKTKTGDIWLFLVSFCLAQNFCLLLTCCLFKHAVNAVNSPVLRQPLGSDFTLHPALLCLLQGFIHTSFPFFCCLLPFRVSLELQCSIIQDLKSVTQRQRLTQRNNTVTICLLIKKNKT